MPSKGCIVIVEPDDLIRELLERWLGEAGYVVAPPTKEHVSGSVVAQLVIADISSPGMPGDTIRVLGT